VSLWLAGLGASAQPAVVAGVWTLDAAKSDFGANPAPGKLTLVITVKGPEFTAKQESDNGVERYTFRSDGQETTNPLPGGGELKAKYTFQGGALTGELHIGPVTMKDRITVGAGNQTMTIDREMDSPEGASKLHMVFNAVVHPAMAGSWKLDPAKSDFGGPMPTRYDARITVAEPFITIEQSNDQGDTTLLFRDDGEESVNEIGAMTMKSHMRWEGDALTGLHVISGNGVEITYADRTTLSADGKLMTLDRTGQTPAGERKLKIVMVKQ
jgi:hypothetical protein